MASLMLLANMQTAAKQPCLMNVLPSRFTRLFRFVRPVICAFLGVAVSSVWASPFEFATTESGQYLLIATQRVGPLTNDAANGEQIDTNNFELGANKAPVPANTSFLDSGGGPTLEGAVPDLPGNAAPVFSGIGGHGNIAITDSQGDINLQDVGVYADPNIGIRLAAPNDSYNKTNNSFFNDPNDFPNTYDSGTGTGMNVNPNDADQSTRIDADGTPGNVGVTFGFEHSALLSELADARTAINGLAGTGVLDVSADGGKITGEAGKVSTLTGGDIAFSSPNSIGGFDITITLGSGLHVFDIMTSGSGSGNDFLLNNANLVIDGSSDAFAIFRLQGGDNMLISNGNVLIGSGGIGMHNVLFFTDQDENDTHFNFNNTIINGVAFWSLGENGGIININNAQGCTQLIADVISLDDVRFNGCAFGEHVPDVSATIGLMAFALAGLGALGHRLGRRRTGN